MEVRKYKYSKCFRFSRSLQKKIETYECWGEPFIAWTIVKYSVTVIALRLLLASVVRLIRTCDYLFAVYTTRTRTNTNGLEREGIIFICQVRSDKKYQVLTVFSLQCSLRPIRQTTNVILPRSTNL